MEENRQTSPTGLFTPLPSPKLFDRFYRVDASRANSRGGTGLGLAIVKTIMDLHGGSVTIESELQRGTSVRLMFPVTVNVDRSQILRDL